MASIRESLWWISEGKLGAVRKPMLEEIPVLVASGITSIVSVMDDPSNLEEYKKENIPFLWFVLIFFVFFVLQKKNTMRFRIPNNSYWFPKKKKKLNPLLFFLM